MHDSMGSNFTGNGDAGCVGQSARTFVQAMEAQDMVASRPIERYEKWLEMNSTVLHGMIDCDALYDEEIISSLICVPWTLSGL